MANFEKAYIKTMSFEGSYSFDENDAGGETYKGISRKYNPTWYGWEIIDDEKNRGNFPNSLYEITRLENEVHKFYKQSYWDVNKLDQFSSQSIAEEMFDTGVNMGIGRAAKFLQECLNYLNRNGSLFSDLVVDGAIGKASLAALNEVLPQDEKVLLTMLNVCQGRHYMEYMTKSPSQRKYCRGWFKRVEL